MLGSSTCLSTGARIQIDARISYQNSSRMSLVCTVITREILCIYKQYKVMKFIPHVSDAVQVPSSRTNGTLRALLEPPPLQQIKT